MAIYRAKNRRAIAKITPEERLANQVVLSGTNQTLDVSKGIFFLEYLEVDGAGTVTLLDGNSDQICSGITAFNNDKIPLRCDYGITITGDVSIAKGFVVEDAFAFYSEQLTASFPLFFLYLV